MGFFEIQIVAGEVFLREDGDDVSGLYEHPYMQQIHNFIIENKLSTAQGDALLNLWTEVKLIV